MLRAILLSLLGSAALCGCSIHPIPDDLSEYSTKDIVRNVRCEAKQAVRERIEEALHPHPELRDILADDIMQPNNAQRISRVDPVLAGTFENFMNSAIAYAFDFNINETNGVSAAVGFRSPFSSGGSLSVPASGSLTKDRTAQRTFKTSETFADLVKLNCDRYREPDENRIYPMTGSIGMGRIMHTFVDLAQMGGGRKFVDTIRFTTAVGGGANASIRLDAVPDQFRLVSANAGVGADREDTHKLVVTLQFPLRDLREARADSGIRTAFDLSPGDESRLLALEALCIALAEQREDETGTLRLYPPEVYCRRPEAASANAMNLIPEE